VILNGKQIGGIVVVKKIGGMDLHGVNTELAHWTHVLVKEGFSE